MSTALLVGYADSCRGRDLTTELSDCSSSHYSTAPNIHIAQEMAQSLAV